MDWRVSVTHDHIMFQSNIPCCGIFADSWTGGPGKTTTARKRPVNILPRHEIRHPLLGGGATVTGAVVDGVCCEVRAGLHNDDQLPLRESERSVLSRRVGNAVLEP